jgi:2-polyprenyl-6-methoxyphenol hydroxylase-like FAD-dependent oxidoreductase
MVTLLERNATPQGDAIRKGVPQIAHSHAMLMTGRQLIENFFPGFCEEILSLGAVRNDLTGDTVRHISGVSHVRQPSKLPGLLASRALIEKVVRARLKTFQNVSIRTEADVVGLATDMITRSVTGVRLRSAPESIDGEVINADMVVDASGRGSRLPEWLRLQGWPAPEEERIKVDIAYTSQWLRRVPGQFNGTASIAISGTRRGAIVLAQEHNRWVLTLATYGKNGAPTNEDEMRKFAQALPTPDISELLAKCEPITPATMMFFPHNQRRRYEQLRDLPKGLLVCGDAFCSFNPVYAQGMTVAAMQADALAKALQSRKNTSRYYFRAAARIIDTPWRVGARNDAYLLGPSKPSILTRATNFYLHHFHQAAATDIELAVAFLQVMHLARKPSSLFTPGIIRRVLIHALRRKHPADLRVPSADTGNKSG